MECSARCQVALATYQFKREAEFRRGSVKPWAGKPELTWKRLKELMDAEYYPRDVKRAKVQEFLSLKQGNTSVLQYAAKFNELGCFAPNPVAIKELKMDHFEQGLKGNIKSMIARHTFDSHKEMYQRAVKITQVLDEAEEESRAAGQMK